MPLLPPLAGPWHTARTMKVEDKEAAIGEVAVEPEQDLAGGAVCCLQRRVATEDSELGGSLVRPVPARAERKWGWSGQQSSGGQSIQLLTGRDSTAQLPDEVQRLDPLHHFSTTSLVSVIPSLISVMSNFGDTYENLERFSLINVFLNQ